MSPISLNRSLWMAGAGIFLLVMLQFIPLGSAQSDEYQVGERVQLKWWTGSQEIWIPGTVTDAGGGMVCARFLVKDTGMVHSKPYMEQCFNDSLVRREGGGQKPGTVPPNPQANGPSRNPTAVNTNNNQGTTAANQPPKAPPAATGRFKVGDRVKANCWGNAEEAVVTGFENGMYKLRFNVPHCGDSREEKALSPADRAPATPAAPDKPLPQSLPPGTYKCFASVPRYIGSSYMAGIGSMPNYSFSWNLQGNLTIEGNGTYRSANGAPARYSYNPGTGQITWHGGFHQGIPSNYGYTKDGKPEILVHRKDGKVGTWHCSR